MPPSLEHFLASSRVHCLMAGTPACDEFIPNAMRAGLTGGEVHCEAGDDKTMLLAKIADAMRFPSFFGMNWDALLDSLRDLEWLGTGAHYIMLREFHELDAAVARTLFEILVQAAEDWRDSSRDATFVAVVSARSCDAWASVEDLCGHA